MGKINVRDRNKNNPDKKPNWEYRFEAAKIDGKRRHISKAGFRTKKEALDAGAKALAEYNASGQHFEPSRISLSDYLDYYYENHLRINTKINTQVLKKGVFDVNIKPVLGSYHLSAITPHLLQEFANGLKQKNYSKSHITNILSALSSALDYAVEPMQYIQSNPMRYVKTPIVTKSPKERIVICNEDFAKIIQRFPDGNRFHLPLMIGYYCGLRISETLALTWDDVDLDNNTITVNKQLLKNGKEWYFQTPKTKSSNRTIRFGETLKKALEQARKRRNENLLLYQGYYTTQYVNSLDLAENQRIYQLQKEIPVSMIEVPLLCTDENGEMTTTDSFKYCSRVIHHELGLAFDYHSLRHTHATKLIEAGANVKAVQTRLGHNNIQTTLQTYVHNTDKMTDEAVDLFEQSAKILSTE